VLRVKGLGYRVYFDVHGGLTVMGVHPSRIGTRTKIN
jgi:hypothetical protein